MRLFRMSRAVGNGELAARTLPLVLNRPWSILHEAPNVQMRRRLKLLVVLGATIHDRPVVEESHRRGASLWDSGP